MTAVAPTTSRRRSYRSPLVAPRSDDWGIIGQFMYRAHAYQRLLDLLRNGLLDIRAIRPRVYPLAALPEAMEAAATAGSL